MPPKKVAKNSLTVTFFVVLCFYYDFNIHHSSHIHANLFHLFIFVLLMIFLPTELFVLTVTIYSLQIFNWNLYRSQPSRFIKIMNNHKQYRHYEHYFFPLLFLCSCIFLSIHLLPCTQPYIIRACSAAVEIIITIFFSYTIWFITSRLYKKSFVMFHYVKSYHTYALIYKVIYINQPLFIIIE